MNGVQKKISVIIPCYNVSAYIDRCMTSIITQTIGIDEIEVICVDDASEDDTWTHLLKWEECFSQSVILIRQEVNHRQGAARNVGLSYASAEWIAFVDADDWLEPDYLEQLYKPAIDCEVDMVCCEVARDTSNTLTFFDEVTRAGEKKEGYISVDTGEDRFSLFKAHILDGGVLGRLLRKSFLMEYDIYFLEDLFYEDLYWGTLVRFYIRRVYIVSNRLYHYFYNTSSTTLCQNLDPYIDHITVQMRRWTDYKKRGLLTVYRDAMEFETLSAAICFLAEHMCTYNTPSYSLFKMESEVIRQQIPDHERQKYIRDFSPVEWMLLDLLYQPIDKSGFLQAVDQVKKLYMDAAGK